MIERNMTVELDSHDIPRLRFNPAARADFSPVDIEIPGIGNFQDESRFINSAIETVRAACGEQPCATNVFISTSGVLGQSVIRMVQGAVISCQNDRCPLIDPPESGDREPLIPSPQPPALEAEVELPL